MRKTENNLCPEEDEEYCNNICGYKNQEYNSSDGQWYLCRLCVKQDDKDNEEGD